ncbi:uncharacterized protein LOC106652561 isoform X1 [Trichogramma pretiosum]|uniref:uncharacterized protein LOC106652561 isoform X1 n=1 Tax=Trichogramma pretiosum TaxID=7493 RepID=UPI0006C975B2|nr:uncharacterized protein LOC106652561 isoform X1 [Trichogramma pretiosum]XP_023315404.1 uncharacterized protein LOC106652561 isoform X1 [Trichogramma pretiosum]
MESAIRIGSDDYLPSYNEATGRADPLDKPAFASEKSRVCLVILLTVIVILVLPTACIALAYSFQYCRPCETEFSHTRKMDILRNQILGLKEDLEKLQIINKHLHSLIKLTVTPVPNIDLQVKSLN